MMVRSVVLLAALTARVNAFMPHRTAFRSSSPVRMGMATDKELVAAASEAAAAAKTAAEAAVVAATAAAEAVAKVAASLEEEAAPAPVEEVVVEEAVEEEAPAPVEAVVEEEAVEEEVAAPAATEEIKITPKLIKELRDSCGAGMMDCKKALMEANGDLAAAAEELRKKGLAQADKKASRIAAEGRMAVATSDHAAVLVEVNCETDFVAKDASFLEFCNSVAETALTADSDDVEALMDGSKLEEDRQALVAKIGENIQVRRMAAMGGSDDSTVGAYVHMNRIGVLVELEGGTPAAAADVAMHVAAMNPPFATADQVPPEVLDKERAFLTEQALESGKPEAIVEKMVEGRIRKYLQEICCDSQVYVKTNDKTVAEMLAEQGAVLKGFTRIAVGEGIEKKVDNFAEEVASMAAGK